MINHISEFMNKHNSIAYELKTDLKTSAEGSEFVFIELTCVYNDFLTYHYFTETDTLKVFDYIDKKVYTYKNFSKLSDESYHFQQMTVHDIGFEYHEVPEMINVLNRIKKEHETKLTKNT
ncbi:hypothetical protein GAP32_377 [Cronobacter phage vB_CsaM_GAP32]|uniref:Uncharacterized protein n=1 Tax=Cronobacter phage vB_CsaM_GAP32 TaxID=1141136 RepID=K4FB70_9CAUD|nr:hypothetical protein GAP32_377 [Cronobacter phage vB_CsaM_GAP32]AFC21829.1 hypothetical protein GAP32_377 [Cronobacter phage vB_CsaM_GAP32]